MNKEQGQPLNFTVEVKLAARKSRYSNHSKKLTPAEFSAYWSSVFEQLYADPNYAAYRKELQNTSKFGIGREFSFRTASIEPNQMDLESGRIVAQSRLLNLSYRLLPMVEGEKFGRAELVFSAKDQDDPESRALVEAMITPRGSVQPEKRLYFFLESYFVYLQPMPLRAG